METTLNNWVEIGAADDIDEEDVVRFDRGDRTFAIYRDDTGGYFASDGLCTHEHVHLADGFVIGHFIECPRHQGRFDIRNGKAKSGPVCIDLRTYPVKIENGTVYVDIGPSRDG